MYCALTSVRNLAASPRRQRRAASSLRSPNSVRAAGVADPQHPRPPRRRAGRRRARRPTRATFAAVSVAPGLFQPHAHQRSLELRRAALQHRGDALAGVGAGRSAAAHQRVDVGVRDGVAETHLRAPAAPSSPSATAARSPRGGRSRLRRGLSSIGRHAAVDQPELGHPPSPAADRPAAASRARRPARAPPSASWPGTSSARGRSCASDMPKRACLARHHEVAVQRQLVAAGDRIALHDRDDRQRVELDGVQHRLDAARVADRRRSPRSRRSRPAQNTGALGADHRHALVGARRRRERRVSAASISASSALRLSARASTTCRTPRRRPRCAPFPSPRHGYRASPVGDNSRAASGVRPISSAGPSAVTGSGVSAEQPRGAVAGRRSATRPMTTRNLEALFAPSAIALIGASNQPGSIGAVLARNLRKAGSPARSGGQSA